MVRSRRVRVHGWITRGAVFAIAFALLAALAAPAGASAFSSVSLHGDAGDQAVAGGGDAASYFYRSDTDTVTARGTAGGLFIDARDTAGHESWHMEFKPPWGQTLQVGTYRARDTPHPPEGSAGMRLSRNSTGCSGTGTFDIRELEFGPGETITRLHLVFVLGCGNRDIAAFGEVRVGLDPPSAATRVQARTIRWPLIERERPGTAVPVVVSQETGSATAGTASLSGPHAAAFKIVDDECAGRTLTAGQDCLVWVQPDPASAGPRVADLQIQVGGTALSTRLEAERIAGRTRILIRQRDHDWVTAGLDWWLDPSDSEFLLRSWATGQLRITATPLDEGPEHWDFRIQRFGGVALAAGTTYDITPALGSLIASNTGYECEMGGTLTVHEIEAGINERIERFSATMLLTCKGVPSVDALVEYRATGPEPAFTAGFPFSTAATWGAVVEEDPVPEEEDVEDEAPSRPQSPPIVRPAAPTRQPVKRPAQTPKAPAPRAATSTRTCARDAGRKLTLRRGTRRADRITGTSSGDRILAGAGNDRVRGQSGGDCLDGGRGNDRLEGDTGGDLLTGGDGRDVLAGGAGDDILIGGAGRDVLRCGPGDDLAIIGRGDRTFGCERTLRR